MTILIPLLALIFIGAMSKGESMQKDDFYAWDSLIKKYASDGPVPWTWVKAIMMNESNLGRAPSVKRGLMDPHDIEGSKSSDGKSWGLMQLTLPTARQFEPLITQVGLNDPEISVRLGVKYLNWLYRLKKGDMEAVVRSYNGGPNYLNTTLGRRDTPVYFERFKQNLKYIQDRGQV